MFHFPEFRANNMTTITPLFSYQITFSCFEPQPTTRCLRRSKKPALKKYVYIEQHFFFFNLEIHIIEQLYRNPQSLIGLVQFYRKHHSRSNIRN